MTNAVELVKKQLEEISELRKLPNSSDSVFKIWHQVTKTIIERKFGEKELKEFNHIHYFPFVLREVSDSEKKQSFDEGLNFAEAFLKGLVKQIEIFGEPNKDTANIEIPKGSEVNNKSIHLVINNAQSNQQTVNITATFNQIIDVVNGIDKSEEEKSEAKGKIGELKKEIEKQNPNWKRVKSILHWLLDFSQKVFLKILPFLLEKYNK